MITPEGFPKVPENFEFETQVVQSSDGEHGLFFHWFKKKGVKPVRGLMILHGQGEHGGRYQHFVHYLQEDYDLILAPDLRGHGRSEGIRGHVDYFEEYLDDARVAWTALNARLGGSREVEWFAHIMGGAITLRLFQEAQDLGVRNLILSAPCVGLTVEVPMVKDIAARLLSRVWGSLQMDTGLNSNHLSHDPALPLAIKKDSLHHTKATPRFYLGFVEAMRKVREERVLIPHETRVLFQLAGDDLIVSTSAAEGVFDRLSNPRKKKIVYPGLYHEIYNETSKDQIFKDLKKWIRGELE
jgi:lysophospholipase